MSFYVKHAVEVTEPLKPKKDDDEDDSDSDDSLEALAPPDDSGDSSNLSVDDDLDSDADSNKGPDEPPEEPTAPPSDEEPEEDEAEAPPSPRARAFPVWRGPRHAPHPFTIEESLWFYTTKTPGEIDLKCHMKGPWRNALEMGHRDMSKTLYPHHYNETWAEPVRTTLLLRAWQIWRPKQRGWAAARDSRLRHLEAETDKLEAAVRATDGRDHPVAPLLGDEDAHQVLVDWVPRLVGRILG